jgi:LPS sulfotransferase NodH
MKAIIIGTQRSGSNFLRHCLLSHPGIVCEGELLINGMVKTPKIIEDFRWPAKIYRYVMAGAWNPTRILSQFLERDDAPVVVFKAMYNHLQSAKVHEFFQQHKEIRIVHLRRDNLLKQYVSKMLLGKKRGQKRWRPHSTKKLPPVTTCISPQAAIKNMESIHAQYQKFETLLSQHPKIELVYETMIEGQCLTDQVSQAICDLFQIEHRKMCCNFVKVNPNILQQMIENYDELADALHGTQYERFLD